MSKIKERLEEPSTFIGLGVIIAALAPILKWDEGEQIGEVVQSVAVPAASGDWLTTASLLIGGIFGVFLKEKGSK
jgi:hypothetical protein